LDTGDFLPGLQGIKWSEAEKNTVKEKREGIAQQENALLGFFQCSEGYHSS